MDEKRRDAAAMSKATNIAPIQDRIPLGAREARGGHAGGVIWLTGLSGAGKSTLAFALEEALFGAGYQITVLDGDNMRHGLNEDLGFAHADRTENIRRVGHVAGLLARLGFICVSAFISPYRTDRDMARLAASRGMPSNRFHEVFVRADLATCERRDPKGLYRRARAGEIKRFTAVDDVYEAPTRPALVVDTTAATVSESLAVLSSYVTAHFAIAAQMEAG